MSYALIVNLLALLTLLALGTSIYIGLLMTFPRGRGHLEDLLSGHGTRVIGTAWLVALVATAGSLYLSEVAGLVPCRLCWYQRIAMYPLSAILGVAFLRRDTGVWRYALPLTLIGLSISTYHALVQLRPALEVAPCEGEVPCSAQYLKVFGFVSIPWMAGGAFLLISVLLCVGVWSTRKGVRRVENGKAGGLLDVTG